jgi:H+/Na+-translocating ferredoxin:NAD+ oxidoreductase subunit C
VNIASRISTKFFSSATVFARKTFGGIQPPTHKEHSLRSQIMSTPIPAQLSIPLGSREQEQITLFVETGERVCKYQKLAVLHSSPDGSNIPVHAPTSGMITSIEQSCVADHSEQHQLCIKLTTDGSDEAVTLAPPADYTQLSRAELISKIHDAGIVGMGGAGFPTAEKLSSDRGAGFEFLIINAAECEPYITADEAIIRERAEKVLLGAELLRQASNAQRCIVAIEESKPDAINALKEILHADGQAASESQRHCEMVIIPSKYPAGSERQLIQCLTGKEIPADQHPTDNGIIVHNIGTAYATFEAITEGKPCISRITTLCGQALKTPKNFEALIGTHVDFLFDLCGIDSGKNHKSILGGTLMGFELASEKAAISKTCNCLIAANDSELREHIPEQACIRCGYCAEVCPARLLPQQLLAFSKADDPSQLTNHGLADCIECGACDYVCPSHIPLVSTFKENKYAIQSRQNSLERSDYWQQRFQYRQYRVKKEKDQAQSKKPDLPKKIAAHPAKAQQEQPGIISKAQASRDIAAAVARVKARRSERDGSGNEPPSKKGRDR